MADRATPASRLDWTGRVLEGRYRIERVLGSGGMGTVYLAHDDRMKRPVVVKVPHVRFLEDDAFRTRFEREVQSLTSLPHPHIVKALDAGKEPSDRPGDAPTPYAVLEYLPGGNLKERLAKSGGRQAPSEVLDWLPEVADALDFIHEEGVVHRDVKPGNVLFDKKGNVYLADFGIAKALGSRDTGLTQTGATPGSPDYMAPEAVSGRGMSPAYDQYALAVMVYEALAGELPHEGDNPLAVIVAKQLKPARPLGDVARSVPPLAAAAVMRALERDPVKRFASCGAFAQAFRAGVDRKMAVAAPNPLEVVVPTVLPPAPPPPMVLRPPKPTRRLVNPADEIRADLRAWRESAPIVLNIPSPREGGHKKLWIVLALLATASLAFLVFALISKPAAVPQGKARAERLGEWVDRLFAVRAVEPTKAFEWRSRLQPDADPKRTEAKLDAVESEVRSLVAKSMDLAERALDIWDKSFEAIGEAPSAAALKSEWESRWVDVGKVLPTLGIEQEVDGESLGLTLTRRHSGLAARRERPRMRILGPSNELPIRAFQFVVRGEVDGPVADGAVTINDLRPKLQGGRFEQEMGLPSGDGAFSVHLEVVRGSEAVARDVVYRVDRTPPQIKIETPEKSPITIEQPQLTIIGRLVEGDSARLVGPEGVISTGESGSFRYVASFKSEATREFEFRATDRAGNESAPARVAITYAKPKPWLEPLQRALAAERRGDLRAAATALDEAMRLDLPANQDLPGLRSAIDRWKSSPELVIVSPKAGVRIVGDEVEITGTLTTGRNTDRLFVDGERVSTSSDGSFRISYKRKVAGAASIVVAVRDGDEIRAQTTLRVTFVGRR